MEQIHEPNTKGRGYSQYVPSLTSANKSVLKELIEGNPIELREAWNNGFMSVVIKCLEDYAKGKMLNLLTIGVDDLKFSQGVIEGINQAVNALKSTKPKEAIK
jgi:hypothetical protein